MPRAKGSKNRRTLERETANKIASARAELVKNAPPLDFSMPLDSLDVMEQAMRHFYFRAKIEERLGDGADWRRVDEAFMRAVHVAEKLARYRHAHSCRLSSWPATSMPRTITMPRSMNYWRRSGSNW